MNNFSCSLSRIPMTIIDCLFYASDSLSWDVLMDYICMVVYKGVLQWDCDIDYLEFL